MRKLDRSCFNRTENNSYLISSQDTSVRSKGKKTARKYALYATLKTIDLATNKRNRKNRQSPGRSEGLVSPRKFRREEEEEDSVNISSPIKSEDTEEEVKMEPEIDLQEMEEMRIARELQEKARKEEEEKESRELDQMREEEELS